MSPGGEHPVDRGWAWVVLLASLGSHFLNGALVYSVGILHTGLLGHFPSDSVTMVAMTGAVNSSLMCIAAPIAGYIINRFGCRTCCVLGGLLCFAGYAASSFVTSVILLFFTFGLTAGTGLGLTYSATNITVGFYFERHRGLASGISNSFSAVGILTGSVCLQAMIETFSVSGTLLLLGAVSLHFCFFGMFYRPTMYEGKAVDIVVEEQVREDWMGMQARYSEAPGQDRRTSGHTTAQQHDKVCDTEEGSESLLESDQQSHDEGHGNVISGLSHAPDDVNTSDMETNRTAAETLTTVTAGVIQSVMSPPSPVVTADLCETGRVCCGNPGSAQIQLCGESGGHHATHANCGAASDVISSALPSAGADETSRDVADVTVSSEPPSASRLSPDDTFHERGGRLCDERDFPATEVDSQLQSEGLVVPDTASFPGQEERDWFGDCAENRKRVWCGTYLGLLSDMAFMLHCASLFVSSVHIAGVFLHLPEYVQHHGTSVHKAAELSVAIGCMSLVSKLSCGFATSDPNIDPLILSMGMMGLNGVITCFFPLYAGGKFIPKINASQFQFLTNWGDTQEGRVEALLAITPVQRNCYSKQMVFSALFGLYFGGLYALINPILVRFAGVSRLADAYGISMFILGGGYLMGPTFAAMIVDGGGTYGHSFLFLGLMMLSGCFLNMAAACFLQSRDKREEPGLNAGRLSQMEGGSKRRQSQPEVASHQGECEWLVEDATDSRSSQSQPLSTDSRSRQSQPLSTDSRSSQSQPLSTDSRSSQSQPLST